MDIDSTKLTVFFEAPFWIGVFERIERRKLSVCKVVFGAEPKDYEVWEYLLKNYSRLRFSPSVETVVKKESVNPKRLQRQIRKETVATGIGTKSQQALQMQREENKLVRKALSRKQREAENHSYKFDPPTGGEVPKSLHLHIRRTPIAAPDNPDAEKHRHPCTRSNRHRQGEHTPFRYKNLRLPRHWSDESFSHPPAHPTTLPSRPYYRCPPLQGL